MIDRGNAALAAAPADGDDPATPIKNQGVEAFSMCVMP
jgi:hypothetical protein